MVTTRSNGVFVLALVVLAATLYFLVPAGEEPGTPASDWTLKDAHGRTHSLADYRGQVVVLDFWATWCPPCRAAMPHVQKLYEQYKDRDVAVFGVNVSESADPIEFMRTGGYTYPILLNGDAVAAAYEVSGIPAFVVIDRAGRLIYRAAGFDERREKQLIKAIEKALQSHDL
jgi:thiol-disulfide isomerase/thioredoxin